jgi:hypothetical protein
MSAQSLELLMIIYGSRDTDILGDERYGADQRRLEIALRPKLPRAGMNPMEISEWANLWCSLHYKNMKHRCVAVGSNRVENTQRMGCRAARSGAASSAVRRSVCPCSLRSADLLPLSRQARAHEREHRHVLGTSHSSKSRDLRAPASPVSPTHPQLISPALQVHFLCDPSTGPCARQLRKLLVDVALQSGRPPPRPILPPFENPADWPPMAACVGCEKEETAARPTRACAGCGVSRCAAFCLLLPVAHGWCIGDRYCRYVIVAARSHGLMGRTLSTRSARSVRLIIGVNTRLSARHRRPSSTSVVGNEVVALFRPCMLHLAFYNCGALCKFGAVGH